MKLKKYPYSGLHHVNSNQLHKNHICNIKAGQIWPEDNRKGENPK